MAPAVLGILGNVGFLGLYLGGVFSVTVLLHAAPYLPECALTRTSLHTGGILSSLAGIAWRRYSQSGTPSGALGASGAIYSVVSFFACAAPTTTFYFFGVLPIPAWAFVTGIFLWDGYHAVNQAVSLAVSVRHG